MNPWMRLAQDLSERSLLSLEQNAKWIGLASAVAVGVALLSGLGLTRKLPRWSYWVWAGLLGVVAVVFAVRLAWIADDAYISFRYADNLLRGQGLVFNPGERIEGYTNFLWTMLVAVGMALGQHPVHVSSLLSLLSLVGVVVLVARIASRSAQGQGVHWPLPLAALAVAGNYAMTSYGTSGLETAFCACMVLLALERAQANSPMAAGFAGIAATMAHPDHALFYGCLGGLYLLRSDRKQTLPRYAVALAPFVIWWTWRSLYYGDFFPNTFYAKSGGGSYFSQGARFLMINAAALGLVAALPLIVVGAVRGRRLIEVQFAVLASGVYLAYVAKIGGDFMLGRLLVSVVPLAALLADHGLRELLRVRRVGPFLSAAAAPLLAVFWLPNGVVRPGEKYFHVADERTFYELKQWFPPVVGSGQLPATKALEKHFVSAGLSPVLGIGCTGLVGFETRLPIVDNFGLTDPVIARMPLGERGRPGHEKLASPGHLLAREVSFADIEIYPPPWRAFTEFTVSGVRYFWAHYDRQLFTALRKQTRVNVFPVEQHLDRLAEQEPAEADAFWCEHAFWSEFYFSRESDPARRQRLIQRAMRGDPSLEGLHEFLFTALDAEPRGWSTTTSFDFEVAPYAGWTRSGDAFSRWPRLEMAVPGQSAVYGQSGRYVSSFTEQLKDRATGALRSDRFKLDGDVLTFRISGGGAASGVSVTLLVEDKPVLSASGCDQELMGRRVWNISQYRGRDAVLEIVDRGRGRWAHVNADEFRVWKRK